MIGFLYLICIKAFRIAGIATIIHGISHDACPLGGLVQVPFGFEFDFWPQLRERE
jgi:hypothetical protein